MDIIPILTAARSSEPSVRVPAELQLKTVEQSNWALYLTSLCQVLANAQAHPEIRQLAGLQLKNALVSKDAAQQAQIKHNWTILDPQVTQQIQLALLRTLMDQSKEARSTAALVVGKIASIDIPRNAWPTLIDHLVATITNPQSFNEARQASFEALGFVCEEVPQHLHSKATPILNAIAQGMYKDQPNAAVKLAATQALANALEFTRDHFVAERERGMIMTMVFQATESSSEEVRVAAYSCLVEIGFTYYEFMPEYIVSIFMKSGKAIQSWLAKTENPALQGECEGVVLQAIEFWSTICESECVRREEKEEAVAAGQAPARPFHEFAKQALAELMPLILACLTRQSEEIDDETWTPAMAAATCLELFARTVRDEIVRHVLPWVERNIVDQANWRNREAATLAFGCILDGPTRKDLAPLVSRAFVVILHFLKDQHRIVKDTAAWTIGRICDVLPETVDDNVLPNLMRVLHEALSDEPKIAAHVCWAIHNLADAVEVDEDDPTSPLSAYFDGIVAKLLECAEREDASETNLVASAYEAVNLMVANSAQDKLESIERLVPVLMSRLTATFSKAALTPQDRERQSEVQGLLCGTLQNIIHKIGPDKTKRISDNLMQLFLYVLNSKNATVHEEALMAIGEVANQVGPDFVKYMTHFKPHMLAGLRNFRESQVCIVSIGVVGDICRALEGKIAAVCDDVMQLLLSNLQNDQVDPSIKPHLVACIGDVALAIGDKFIRYLAVVVMMLSSSGRVQLSPNQDNFDFVQHIRCSILECYTSILQALGSGQKANQFQPFLSEVQQFLVVIVNDPTREDTVTARAAGLIGDLAMVMGNLSGPILKTPAVHQLLMSALTSKEASTREKAEWAKERLSTI